MATQTVNFTFKAGDGTARARSASFVLTASPVIDGTTLVIGETVNASIAADGTGTVDLHPGDYKLTLTGEPNTITISVPTSGTPHRLESLTGAGTTYVNSDILSGGSDWPEQASVPAAPAAGKSKLYFKSDGLLYSQDEAGTETVFASAGSGYVTVQEDGTGVTARTKLNFTGAGLTATDDAGNTRTQVALAALLNDIAGITAATGDILYYDGANIIKLAVGSNTEVLTITAGVPTWAAATGGGDLSAADIDQLAELNAIVTDATLIDTADARLSDARTPTAHNHTESEISDLQSYLLAASINTIAKLNAIIADATLIDTGDSRLSDSRTPTAHNHAASEITSGTLPPARLGAASIDAITEIHTDLKTGLDTKLVTGTAGTATNMAVWDANGDIIDGGAPTGGGSFDSLSDTTVTTIAAGEIIKWSGTAYINNTLAEAGIAASTNVANWDTAYGWGDHSSGGYLAATDIDQLAELNAIVTDATLIDTADARLSDARTPTAHNQAASTINSGTMAHERGGLEADVSAYSGFLKIAGGVTSAVTDSSSNWDTAFGWGDHSATGYLSALAEDAAPQLSATLDCNGFAIGDTSAGAIVNFEAPIDAQTHGASANGYTHNGSPTRDRLLYWNSSDVLTPSGIDPSTLIATTDARLSDARTPTAHNQAASTITSGTLAAARLPAASTSAVGGLETATAAEINTGTDAGRAVSPDSLAGSNYGTQVVSILVSDPNGDAITTGDGKAYWRVPSTLAGFNLIAVAAQLTTVSSSGIPTIQIHNVTDAADMLSTELTIDASEIDSSTATTAAVIDTAADDVTTGDQLRFDLDIAGTGAKGWMIELQFRLP
jgi:hypothetical protein